MRILITGGAGFIGSQVADAYRAAGHDIGVVDDLSTGSRANVHPDHRFWRLDVRDQALNAILAEFRPAVVNHHAAQMSVSASVRDPQRDADINILGSVNLLESARRHGVRRVIFASTGGAMYGDQETLPTPESVFPAPVSPYGVAKLAVERYLHAFHAMHGLTSVALRYANVYGPRQNPHGEAGVVAIFCRTLHARRSLTVNGDGEQTRDYVYVGDIVRANLLAADAAVSDGLTVLNIGAGIETSVNTLAQLLGSVSGVRSRVEHGPARPGEQRRSALDASRAGRVLGWGPRTPLQAGLQQTFDWFGGTSAPETSPPPG